MIFILITILLIAALVYYSFFDKRNYTQKVQVKYRKDDTNDSDVQVKVRNQNTQN